MMAAEAGIAASIIAIIQLTGKITALGYDYIGSAQRATQDHRDFINEVNSLTAVLEILRGHVSTTSPADSTALSKLTAPLSGCDRELHRVLSILQPRGGAKGVYDKLVWPFKRGETLDCIGRIERHKSLFAFALTADQVALSKAVEGYIQNSDILIRKIDTCVEATSVVAQNTYDTVQDFQKEFQTEAVAQRSKTLEVDRIHSAENRRKVLNWVYPEATDTKHIEIRKKRQRNTGNWLFKNPEFQKWADDPDAGLIWGYGIPGAGKTVLSSAVIDHFEAQAEASNYGVAYVYFDYIERGQQTPTNVMASLVKQLASQIPDLPAEIEDLYHTLDRRGKHPSMDDLYTTLLVTRKSFSQVFLIFDALDECHEEEQRMDLLPLFEHMGVDGINLFLTSRPYPEDVQDYLSDVAKIEISAQKDDIKIYIEEKINENRRAKRLINQAKCKDQILDELTHCAKGMFLFVRFNIEYLCQQTTPRQVLTALEKIKTSSTEVYPLDPTYDRAMENIHRQQKSRLGLAMKVLSWLVRGKRSLTMDEIRVAVSIEPHQYELDELDLPARATLVDVCAGLVVIDEGANTIRLAHYTVQEYLVKNSIPTVARFNLAMACTTYLSLDIFSKPCGSEEKLAKRVQLYPFFKYATLEFAFHLNGYDLPVEMLLRFLNDPGAVSSYNEYTGHLGMISVAPLHLASSIGHSTAVKALLRNNNISLSTLNIKKETALHIAAHNGHKEVVKLFLEKGANPFSVDFYGRTVLHSAVIGGNIGAVKLLLEKEPKLISIPNKISGSTVLHQSIFHKHEEISQFLLEKGVDIFAREHQGKTALHMAAQRCLPSLVRSLLDMGSDLSKRNLYDETALHLAARGGSKEVVQLLLERGANLFDDDKDGITLLHHAAHKGERTLIQLLLEMGLNVSASDRHGFTALHRAASGGNDTAVKILIESGADISLQNKAGETALHIAAYKGKVETVRFLLQKGADASVRNLSGKTAKDSHLSGSPREKKICELLDAAIGLHPD